MAASSTLKQFVEVSKSTLLILLLLLSSITNSQVCSNTGNGVDGAYVATTNTTIAGGVYNFTSFTINSGVTVTVTGSQPLELRVTGNVVIDGVLSASGGNGTPGVTFSNAGTGGIGVAGGGNGGNGTYDNVSGPIDASDGIGLGGVGNKGAQWSGGGGAGYATVGGSTGNASGGFGGAAYSNAQLSPLSAGSGGGGGSGGNSCGSGGGGAGGGLIIIYAGGSITVSGTGAINANGGNGGSDGGGNCGAGGGGSGGTILLSSNSIDISGSLSAVFGVGGSSTVGFAPYFGIGANGANGRIRIDALTLTGAGVVTPTPQVNANIFTNKTITGGSFCSGNTTNLKLYITGDTTNLRWGTSFGTYDQSNFFVTPSPGVTTYYVIDSSSCNNDTAVIEISLDNVPPVVTCPSDITVDNEVGTCGAVVTYTTPTGTDNCAPTVSGSQTFNYTGSIESFVVPANVTSITMKAYGAQGGSVTTTCAATGGLGAKMEGEFAVTPGETLSILVGQQGRTNGSDAGGGGGTYIVRAGNVPLLVAGGGGGATNNIGNCGGNRNGIDASINTSGTASGNGLVAGGTNGNGGGASSGSGGGGGGFFTDGVAGTGLANNNGKAYVNGGAGGTGNNNDFGGFGGGGAGWFTGGNGGGGGGYSGGGTSGSQPFSGGGGGGSYNAGTNQVNTAGVQTGNGFVELEWNVVTLLTATQIEGLASGATFPVGTTTNTFVVDDGNGNTDTCSFTVTVNDTSAPTAACQNLTVYLDGTGNATVNAADVNSGSTDNCGIETLSVSPSTFACTQVGANTVTLTVIDSSGNSSTCTATVTVQDTSTATLALSCPSDIIVSESPSCVAVVNFTNPTVTGTNCCTVVMPNSGYTYLGAYDGHHYIVSNTGTTWSNARTTALGLGGDLATIKSAGENNFLQTALAGAEAWVGGFQNTSSPSYSEPSNGWEWVDGDTFSYTNWLGGEPNNSGVEDHLHFLGSGFWNDLPESSPVRYVVEFNCPVLLQQTAGLASGSDFPVDTTVVEFTATNANNAQVATCSFNVIVQDTAAPLITSCRPSLVGNLLYDNGPIVNSVGTGAGGADESVLETVALSMGTIGFGHQIVTGNRVADDFTVTDPNWTIDSIHFYSYQTGSTTTSTFTSVSLRIFDGPPNAGGNVIFGDLTTNYLVSSVFSGVYRVTETTIGNSQRPIMRNTVSLGGLNLPAGTYWLDWASAGSLGSGPWANPIAILGQTTTGNALQGISGNYGNAIDGGTSAQQGFPFQVFGSNGFSQGGDTLYVASNSCVSTIALPTPNATDCSGIETMVNSFNNTADASGDYPVGENTVVWTITDSVGKSSTCQYTITVLDTFPPTAVCQDITVYLDATGNVVVNGVEVNNGSTDLCTGIASLSVSPNTFTCANLGANTVTLTVTDSSGNSDTCTATVTVADTINPTALCKPATVYLDGSGNASLAAIDVDNGSSGVCGVSLSVSPSSFTCSNLGTNTVTLTATSDGGSNTCQAQVTVVDTVDPTITCPADISAGTTTSCGAVVTYTAPAFSDNCTGSTVSSTVNYSGTLPASITDNNATGITLTQNVTSFGSGQLGSSVNLSSVCFRLTHTWVGDLIVRLRAPNGTIVTLVDRPGVPASTFGCSQNNMDVCFDLGTGTGVESVCNTSGSPSTFAISGTFKAHNGTNLNALNTAGGNADGNWQLIVSDNGAGDIGAVQAWSLNFTQNVGSVTTLSQIAGLPSGATFPKGTTTNTFVATDGSGNSDTCSFTVTVADTTRPVANCQNITVQLDASGNASITAAQVNNGSTDNCGIASLSVSPNTFTCGNIGANTVTLTVTDTAGNTNTCTATVTVQSFGATITATPLAASYIIQENFNGTFPPAGWVADNNSNPLGTLGWFQGVATNFPAFNGPTNSYASANFNSTAGTGTISNWLILPEVTVRNGDQFSFFARRTTSVFPDRMQVRLSTSGSSVNVGTTATDLGDFTTLLLDINPNLTAGGFPSTWTQFTVTISGLSNPTQGRVAFRYFVTNGGPTGANSDLIGVDSVTYFSVGDSICEGETANLVVNTSGAAGVGPFAVTYTDGTNNYVINPYTSGTNIPVTPTTTTTYSLVSVTSANSCSATSLSGTPTVAVYPAPVVDPVSDEVACNGDTTNQVTFTGTATTYTWTNSNTSIGLAASGTGNIPSFTAVNTGTIPVIAEVVVTPFDNVSGCTGIPDTFTYTIDPTPNVNPTADIIVCAGETVNTIQFTGTVPGSNFSWTNDNTSIGLGSLGIGDIQSFTATNTGSTPITAQIVVFAGYNDCSGVNDTFTITVNPGPTAVCQDITVYLDANGNATVTAAAVDNGSSSLCGAVSLSLSQTAFDCSNLGPNAVVLTVTDAFNNTATCNATVTISDTVAPTLTCPADITVSNDAGLCGAVVNFSAPVAADNCGGTTVQLVNLPFGGGAITDNSPAGVAFSQNVTQFGGGDLLGGNVFLESVCFEIQHTWIGDLIVSLKAPNGTIVPLANRPGVPASTFGCSQNNINACVELGTGTGMEAICNTSSTPTTYAISGTYMAFAGANLDAINTAGGNANGTWELLVSDNAGGDLGSVVSWELNFSQLLPTAGTTTQIAGLASGAIFPVGTTTNTFVVDDGNGNTDTCSFNVTVNDTEAPTFGSQNCSGGVFDITFNGVGFDNFIDEIEWTLTDGSNTVIGSGDFPPGTSGTETVTVNGTTGPYQLVVTATNGIFGDNEVEITVACSGSTIATGFVAGVNAAGTGTTTLSNLCCLSGACPSNIVVNANPGDCNAVVNYTTPIAVDNCAGVTQQLTAGLAGGSTFPTGTTTINYEATDAVGNVSNCTFTVTVLEVNPPTAICQDITVYLDQTGVVTITPADVNNGSFDDCGIDSLSLSRNTFTCGDVGVNSVALIVTDLSGNVSACFANVTVVDTVPFTITCPGDITASNDPGQCGAVVNYNLPIAADNCIDTARITNSLSNTIVSPNAVACIQTGFGHRNNAYLRVYDLNNFGYTSGNDFNLTHVEFGVEDAISGGGTQPVTVNVYTLSGALDYSNMTLVTSQNITVADQSGTLVYVPMSATIPGGSTMVVEVFTPDGTVDGNFFFMGSNSFGQTGPSYIAAANCGITQPTDFATIGFPNVEIVLNALSVPQTTITQITGLASGSVFPVGTTVNTFVAENGLGTSDTCSFTVTVADTSLPVAVCQDVTVYLDATGNVSITANDIDNGSTDNCGIETKVVSPDAFTCANAGANTVTLTVTDTAGNVSTCTATVTVVDTVAPVAACQNFTAYLDANGSVTVTGADVDGGATDNCAVTNITVTPNTFTCNDIGAPVTVTVTFEDAAGNTSSCTADITVLDTVAPVIVCLSDINVTNELGTCGATVTFPTPFVSDNCDGSSSTTVVNYSGNLPASVVDNGNSTFTENVTTFGSDLLGSNVNLQSVCFRINHTWVGDLTVSLRSPSGTVVELINRPGRTTSGFGCSNNDVDMCVQTGVGGDAENVCNSSSPTISGTYFAFNGTDLNAINNGGPANGNWDLLVNDAATLDFGSLISWSMSFASTGANTTVTQVAGLPSGSTFPVGTTANTFVATDLYGNSDTCTFNVIVQDTSLPVAVCQDINVQLDITGNATITANDINNGSTDNCGILSMVVTPNTFNCSNVGANTVTLTVTDSSGNVNTCSATVTVAPSLTIDSIVLSNYNGFNVSCNGSADGTATVYVTSQFPLSYLWSNGQTTQTATGLTAGNYSVTVTAGGCTAVESVTLTEPTPVVASAAVTSDYNGQDISCYGAADGEATATVSGGVGNYTYAWSTSPTQTNATATGLAAGLYTVTVTDANGCTTTADVTLTQPDSLTIGVVLSDYNGFGVRCFGSNDGTITLNVTGGTGVYTYAWPASAAIGNTNLANGLLPGVYNITVTDVNGCSKVVSPELTEPTQVQTTIAGTSPKCNGGNDGSASVVATGGTGAYSYVWNTTPAQTNDTATGLVAGTYTVTVTDANGCTSVNSVTLSQPALLVAIAQTTSNFNGYNVSCFGGSNGTASVNVVGGTAPYTYNWSGGVSAGNTVSGLAAGNYTVTVTDANNCTAVSSITVTQPSRIVASAAVTSNYNGAQVSCFGSSDGIAAATATGGIAPYFYNWSTNPTQSNPVATGLSAGTYTVTITDLNGCTDTASVTVTQPTAIVASGAVTSNYNGYGVSCNGGNNGTATITATGGTGVLTYSWPASTGVGNTANGTGLTAGTYVVTVVDINKCVDTAVIIVTEPTEVKATTASQSVRCFGNNDGKAWVTATGGVPGYTFTWNTTPAQTTDTAFNLVAGTYSVTVTDQNGCTTVETVVVTEPTLLEVVATADGITCPGGSDGSATVVATGGVGNYTFTWNTVPVQTGATVTGLTAGVYSVTVTDANGCTSTDTAEVTVKFPVLPTATVSGGGSVCEDEPRPDVVITFTGFPPYNFTLNDGSTSTNYTGVSQSPFVIAGASAGTYTVTNFSDANCEGTEDGQAVVRVNPIPSVIVTGGGYVCDGEQLPSVEIDFTGTAPWDVVIRTPEGRDTLIEDAGSSPLVFNPTTEGFYIVRSVSDSNGCVAFNLNATKEVGYYLLPLVDAGESKTVDKGFSVVLDGEVITAYGGLVTYNWTPDSSLNSGFIEKPTARPFVTTLYTLEATDKNGCKASDTVTVNVSDRIVLDIINVFTPDGDGINEFFVIRNRDAYANLEVTIVNRWGHILFESDNYNNEWDGTWKGKPVDDGTYYYVIKEPVSGKVIKGAVTILRGEQ